MAYPLSSRRLEELIQERGVSVDHATINRWVLKYSPQLEAAFHRRQAAGVKVFNAVWTGSVTTSVRGRAENYTSPGMPRAHTLGAQGR